MTQDFGFFKTTMPSTRKADYYLGCLDGSVFIDFDKTENNIVSLVRISFDGYGCCNLNEKAKFLNREDSNLFIAGLHKENLNQEVIANLVLKAINMNKENLWDDALIEYELIEQE